jgi:hypothetical protein
MTVRFKLDKARLVHAPCETPATLSPQNLHLDKGASQGLIKIPWLLMVTPLLQSPVFCVWA